MSDPTDDIRAGVVAHGIRLGKQLQVGMKVDFLAQVKTMSKEDLNAGLLDNFTPVTEPIRVCFIVEQRDIDNAIKLINSQRASYREPKMTVIDPPKNDPE